MLTGGKDAKVLKQMKEVLNLDRSKNNVTEAVIKASKHSGKTIEKLNKVLIKTLKKLDKCKAKTLRLKEECKRSGSSYSSDSSSDSSSDIYII